jgi:hypothetical protein
VAAVVDERAKKRVREDSRSIVVGSKVGSVRM